MMHLYQNTRILVIDLQPYWRQLSTLALREAGFFVKDCEDYHSALPQKDDIDLFILSCAKVGPDEQRLITLLLQEKYHLLVLSAYLPQSVMRSLYLQGVDDIADKPYDPVILVNLVQQVLDKIAPSEDMHLVEERASLW
jgi:DNA-binding response OmpR family regulator